MRPEAGAEARSVASFDEFLPDECGAVRTEAFGALDEHVQAALWRELGERVERDRERERRAA